MIKKLLFEAAVAKLNLPEDTTTDIITLHEDMFEDGEEGPKEIKKDWETKVTDDGETTTITTT